MHYDVTSCAVICISNNVEYLENEGRYKNSKFPDQCHSIANTSKFTQQCNVVPYFYAVYWLRPASSAFSFARKCN